MYDELVKELRHCATDPMHCLSCGEDKDGRCFARLMTQAADAIEELSVVVRAQKAVLDKFPRWIPVTEQPQFKVGDDCYNGYLVYANGYYEIADYTMDELDGVPYFYVDGEYEAYITHFMPLPEPPKEET